MPTPIRLTLNGLELPGELNDTETGALLSRSLPLEGTASRWGREYYFSVPVSADLEAGATDVVEPGELGYWPVGSALCLFWGPPRPVRGANAGPPVRLIGSVL